MFTGIIVDVGVVERIVKNGDWVLTIKTDKFSLARTAIGASICCSGACLTVIAKTENSFDVQVSSETLDKTTLKNWKEETKINLEPALRMGDELGGHLVSGHVDTTTRVTSRMQDGDSLRLQFALPRDLARFLAPKGSIVIDGVSLTVNEVEETCFGVNVIPHTQQATTLGVLHMDDEVNFEVDMMARYTERLLRHS